MRRIAGTQLERLQSRLGNVIYEMTRVQFTRFNPPHVWSPALNVYRCESSFVICADLAGVDKQGLHLQVEPKRLLMHGRRDAPEPRGETCQALQVLALEIDYGVFEREVLFPAEVEPDRVTAEQKDGLLWIYLPFRAAA